MLSRIYVKIKSSPIKGVLQYSVYHPEITWSLFLLTGYILMHDVSEHYFNVQYTTKMQAQLSNQPLQKQHFC